MATRRIRRCFVPVRARLVLVLGLHPGRPVRSDDDARQRHVRQQDEAEGPARAGVPQRRPRHDHRRTAGSGQGLSAAARAGRRDAMRRSAPAPARAAAGKTETEAQTQGRKLADGAAGRERAVRSARRDSDHNLAITVAAAVAAPPAQAACRPGAARPAQARVRNRRSPLPSPPAAARNRHRRPNRTGRIRPPSRGGHASPSGAAIGRPDRLQAICELCELTRRCAWPALR